MESLTKLLIASATLVGLTFGQQYQAKNTDKINVFVQPNDSTLAYYGSLDINKDNVLNLYNYNPNVIETREQAMDETYPYLTLTAPENGSLQNSKRAQISISGADEHFDRIGFSFNGSDTTWTSNQDTTFYVNSQEGDNEFLAIAEDKAGNRTLEKRTYTYDPNYVSIEDNLILPTNFKLYQNYPNPFNPSTTIQFDIPLNPPSKGDNNDRRYVAPTKSGSSTCPVFTIEYL